MGPDNSSNKFILELLNKRTIIAMFDPTTTQKSVNRGTTQGGVLSSLLWNIALNSLLTRLYSLGFKTIAYDDDVALTISGVHLNTLSSKMENAFKILND